MPQFITTIIGSEGNHSFRFYKHHLLLLLSFHGSKLIHATFLGIHDSRFQQTGRQNMLSGTWQICFINCLTVEKKKLKSGQALLSVSINPKKKKHATKSEQSRICVALIRRVRLRSSESETQCLARTDLSFPWEEQKGIHVIVGRPSRIIDCRATRAQKR